MENNEKMTTTEELKSIVFHDVDGNEEVEFFVMEQTCISGITYLLVTDEPDGDGDSDAYILKEIQTEEDDVIYEMVEDDVEFEAISKVFMEMMDDFDFELE